MRMRCLPTLTASLLVLVGCQKPADTQRPGATAEEKDYDIKGKVTAVAPDKTSVTLDHEEIPGLMKAMEMKYPVSDAKVLDGIAAGDKVSGRLKAKGTDYTITKLEKR